MRSDRILVVMDGEIIEEGSHNELIRTRGKYHDLWSKQVVVKPGVELSKSKNPPNDDGSLINDLDSDECVMHLAKSASSTEHSERTQKEEGKISTRGEESRSGHKHKRGVGDRPE